MLRISLLKYAFCVLLLSSIIAPNIVISSEKEPNLPMLWDFGADKCIPCRKMAPILDKMEKEYKGKLIVKFTDVWKTENIKPAKENGIQSIPTQIFFDENGKELWRHVGFISEEDILAKCKSFGYDFQK